MTIEELSTTWISNTDLAIRKIEKYLYVSSGNNNAELEFKSLAGFILGCDYNPYSYMPEGWAYSINSAQSFSDFLGTLHHAMLDDGDLCFSSDSVYGPKLFLNDRYDVLEGRVNVPYKSKNFSIHTDSARFMKELGGHNQIKQK